MIIRDLGPCVEYARTRRRFGRPIGSFQAVADLVVDCKIAQLRRHRIAKLLGFVTKAICLLQGNCR
jgi:hypothetical protein